MENISCVRALLHVYIHVDRKQGKNTPNGATVKDRERSNAMKNAKTAPAMQRRFERLKAGLLKLGPVAQGSILARTLERPDPAAPGRKRRLGPYYQWTRKIGGRTVNVNLSPAQAKVFGRAIAQHRRLEAILDRMRELSLEILEASTEWVKKRKSRTSKDLALS
jgi:Family of unknown function (DUF6788)